MVTTVTSLTGNGLKDWLIQRFTALLLLGYFLFLFGYIACHPGLDYARWATLFHCIWVQLATSLALFAFLFHAFIGLWTVTTDYIHCVVIRLMVQGGIVLILGAQVIWGLMMIWMVHG